MKRGNWVIRLVFGILGGIYALIGLGFLLYAAPGGSHPAQSHAVAKRPCGGG